MAARLRGDLWSRRQPSLWTLGFILSAKGAPDRRSLLRGRVRGRVGPGMSRLSSRGGVGCDRGRQRSFAYLPRAENAAERGIARWRALVAREDPSWRGASNALATWGRSAARRSGAAMRSEVASIRSAVGSAKAGCSGVDRSKGCSCGSVGCRWRFEAPLLMVTVNREVCRGNGDSSKERPFSRRRGRTGERVNGRRMSARERHRERERAAGESLIRTDGRRPGCWRSRRPNPTA